MNDEADHRGLIRASLEAIAANPRVIVQALGEEATRELIALLHETADNLQDAKDGLQ